MRHPLMHHSTLSLLTLAALASQALAQNDDCSGAIFLQNGANGPFSNAGSTTSFAWNCAFGDNDVWFAYVAAGAGTLTIDACGAGFDTVMELFDGSGGCGALVSLDCNDDTCGLASTVTTTVVPGGTYYLRVGGYGGDLGSFPLNVSGPAGSGNVATVTSIGVGCVASFASFYENFPTAQDFDLNGVALTMLPTSPGYLVLPLGTYVPPSGAATSLTLVDDDEISMPLTTPFAYDGGVATSLTVCSNGSVWVATGNSIDYEPYVSDLLNAPQTGWWVWHDFNPTEVGSGQVKFEEVGTMVYITWDGVYDFSGASAADASTFQFQFDCTTGSVAIVFSNVSTLGASGQTFLVGYSPGGNSSDPGSVDLSSTLPTGFAVSTDVSPLSLVATSRPVTGTTWGLSTTNIPATGLLGLDILGFANPGIPDLGFLGMPGCGLYASLDLMGAWVVGGPHTWGLPIPNNPTLVGIDIYASAAVFQVPPVNTFGAIMANGLQGHVGDI